MSPRFRRPRGVAPTSINLDTSGTTLTCSATSPGGTASQSVHHQARRDGSDDHRLRSRRQPNSDGWNNSDVVVSFTCDDNLSGVAGCGPDQTLSRRRARDQSVDRLTADRLCGVNMTLRRQRSVTIDIDAKPRLATERDRRVHAPYGLRSTSAGTAVVLTEGHSVRALHVGGVDPNLGHSSSGSGMSRPDLLRCHEHLRAQR